MFEVTGVAWGVEGIADERYTEMLSSRWWHWSRRVPSRVARINKHINRKAHAMIGTRVIVAMIGCDTNGLLVAFAERCVICGNNGVVVVADSVGDVVVMMLARMKKLQITAIVNGVMMMNMITWIIAVMWNSA